MKRLSWLLIVGLCAFSALGADDLVVKNWVAGGTKGCSKKNIQLISNGDVFSLLFDSVRVELLENQKKDGFAKDAFCEVAILFEVPKGKCIDHLDQVLAGGVLKSTGSEGALRFLTFMNGKTPVNEKITWSKNQEILPQDAASIFSDPKFILYPLLKGQVPMVRDAGAFTWTAFQTHPIFSCRCGFSRCGA